MRTLLPFLCCLLLPIASPALADEPAQASLPESELSIDDLGISATAMRTDPGLQRKLERRTWMLKTHQILGIVTALPMLLTYGSGPEREGGGSPSRSSVHRHMALGITTTALYATTASFALLAPNPEHPRPRGASKLHRWLAWIHAPLMVAAPVLGAIADHRLKAGKSAGWAGNAHGAAVTGLLISYGAAVSVMVFNF